MLDVRRLLPLTALAVLLATAACTGEEPPGLRPGVSACPERVRGAEGVIARAVVPPEGPAVLCRYRHVRRVDSGHRLVGQTRLDGRTAGLLAAAFVHRSRAMVDCGGDPRLPLYAVLDRDTQGRPRVVTVDLAFCGTIEAEVAGVEEHGLATDRHRHLLEEAWRGR